MKTIFKYRLQIADKQTIKTHDGARTLYFALQAGVPCVWLKVDTDQPIVEKVFSMCGTGHDLEHLYPFNYIGSIQQQQFVWHLFD